MLFLTTYYSCRRSSSVPCASILSSSLLACLELLHIPPTNCHISLILVHALREVLDIRRTWALLCGTLRLRLAVVEATVHWLRICVGRARLLGCLLRGAATEEAADGVADRRADCYTAI